MWTVDVVPKGIDPHPSNETNENYCCAYLQDALVLYLCIKNVSRQTKNGEYSMEGWLEARHFAFVSMA